MKRLLAGEAALLLTVLCQPGVAQVSFRGFDVKDAGIDDMSADGSVVVGRTARAPVTTFRWTSAGGIEDIGGDTDRVRVSRDGKTIVGAALDSQGNRNAAIWMGGKNWKLLGGVPGGAPNGAHVLSEAYDVSADGSVIVGIAYLGEKYFAFRWDAQNGMVNLGTMGIGSVAWAVSADGNVPVGYDRQPGPLPIPPDGPARHDLLGWNGAPAPSVRVCRRGAGNQRCRLHHCG